MERSYFFFFKLTPSSLNNIFVTPTRFRQRLDWLHPSGTHTVISGALRFAGAWRVCCTCQGTNKQQRQKLPMGFGCEPAPGAALSSAAVLGCVSTGDFAMKTSHSALPGLPAMLQGWLHMCNERISARVHSHQPLTAPPSTHTP